jgi:hypothetical protein
MDRLNSHFLHPFPTTPELSGDGQSALVVKLGVSPSRSRQLTGSHRYHPGTVQQAQGRSAETAVSPRYNKQSTRLAAIPELRYFTLSFYYCDC